MYQVFKYALLVLFMLVWYGLENNIYLLSAVDCSNVIWYNHKDLNTHPNLKKGFKYIFKVFFLWLIHKYHSLFRIKPNDIYISSVILVSFMYTEKNGVEFFKTIFTVIICEIY